MSKSRKKQILILLWLACFYGLIFSVATPLMTFMAKTITPFAFQFGDSAGLVAIISIVAVLFPFCYLSIKIFKKGLSLIRSF